MKDRFRRMWISTVKMLTNRNGWLAKSLQDEDADKNEVFILEDDIPEMQNLVNEA